MSWELKLHRRELTLHIKGLQGVGNVVFLSSSEQESRRPRGLLLPQGHHESSGQSMLASYL